MRFNISIGTNIIKVNNQSLTSSHTNHNNENNRASAACFRNSWKARARKIRRKIKKSTNQIQIKKSISRQSLLLTIMRMLPMFKRDPKWIMKTNNVIKTRNNPKIYSSKRSKYREFPIRISYLLCFQNRQ